MQKPVGPSPEGDPFSIVYLGAGLLILFGLLFLIALLRGDVRHFREELREKEKP